MTSMIYARDCAQMQFEGSVRWAGIAVL